VIRVVAMPTRQIRAALANHALDDVAGARVAS